MDAVNLWLDPQEVRRLAEQLMRPVTRTPDPGFDPAFVGFTHHDPAPTPQTPPTAQKTQSEPRFLERVEIFSAWLARNIPASGSFLLGENGRVIFDKSDLHRLHAIARNVGFAARNQEVAAMASRVKTGPSAILEVIPCDTSQGRIVLGMLVENPLPLEHIATIKDLLTRTASPA